MINLNEAFRAIQLGWNNSRLKYILKKSTVLGHFFYALPPSQDMLTLYNFINSYLKSSLFFRQFFKSYIQDQQIKTNLDIATKIFGLMKDADILTRENFTAVALHANPWDFARILISLNQANILTQENSNTVARHRNPWSLSVVLDVLNQSHILTQENFIAVAGHRYPEDLILALNSLHQGRILTEENLIAVAGNGYPQSLAKALNSLNQGHILTQENRTAVARHAYPQNLAEALNSLNQGHILTQENRTAVAGYAYPPNLAEALKSLNKGHILTQENRTAVTRHRYPHNLANALNSLHQARVLTQENRITVARHAYLEPVARALNSLHQAHILTQENFTAVSWHANPEALTKVLNFLNQANILTQENFNALAKHGYPEGLANALNFLKQANILIQENFNAVAEHAYPEGLANALDFLNQANILMQEIFNAVAEHGYPEDLANALDFLNQAKILTQENRIALAGHADPDALARALNSLHQARILTQDNRTAVAEHTNPEGLARVLNYLNQAYILTPTNRTAVAGHEYPILLNTNMKERMWNRLAPHHVRLNWTRILEAAQTQNPQEALTRLTNQILGVNEYNPRRAGLNGAQSTHTASVHATTDLTAWLLSTQYRFRDPATLTSFDPIIARIASLTPNTTMTAEQITIAIYCLDRLERSPVTIKLTSDKKKRSFHYIDSYLCHDIKLRALIPALKQDRNRSTEITLFQFVQWLFLAISGNQSADYMGAFVSALYEIQRGYNLDETGQDNRAGEDDSICFGGTANKFCERLNGLSPLIQFIFTSPVSIALKVKPLLLDTLLAHCKTLLTAAQAGGLEEQQRFCLFINDLKNPDTVSDIYTTLFSKEIFLPILIEEFKANTILTGGTHILTEQIESFERDSLPYLPAIDIDAGPNSIYTDAFLKEFSKFNKAKIAFEKTALAVLAPAATELEEHGIFATSRKRRADEAGKTSNSVKIDTRIDSQPSGSENLSR